MMQTPAAAWPLWFVHFKPSMNAFPQFEQNSASFSALLLHLPHVRDLVLEWDMCFLRFAATPRQK